MNNQEAAIIVLKYIDEDVKDETDIFYPYFFKKKSYSLWAAFEIVELLLDNPTGYPVNTIYNFLYKMEYYRSLSKNENEKDIFLRACETAQEIVLLFL